MMRWRAHPEVVRAVVVTAGRAVCVAVAAGAAVALGQAVSGRHTSWVWLGATVLVAATVALTRPALERLADRAAYGPGGDPYAELSQFVQRISDSLAVDDVLPHVARTVTRALHSPRGEVRLWLADGEQWRQTWPPDLSDGATNVDVPLHHRGEQVGMLGVDTASGGLSVDERELLDRLAGTAGLALANVRLAYDLRRRIAESHGLADQLASSRERLLAADALETARFSDLVDRQVLSRLRTVGASLTEVAAGASGAVQQAIEAATEALAALRDLAAGVFPPALADRGLVPALEAHCARYAGRVSVRSNAPDRRMPFAVEAAAYFCAVHVIDGAVDAGEVTVVVDQDGRRLELRTTGAHALSAETLELLRDRVEATDGSLEHWNASPEGSIAMTWDVSATTRSDPAPGRAVDPSGRELGR